MPPHPLRLLLLPVAALLVALVPTTAAAQPAEIGSRIINGSPAAAGVWPSIAHLIIDSAYGCTGSLVAPRVVLTAGHCVYASGSLANPAASTARVGVIDRTQGTAVQWASSVAHPSYQPGSFPYDVALVTLSSASSAPPMRIISPWQDGLVTAGATAWIAGWGSTIDSAPWNTPTALGEAQVPVIGDASCSQMQGNDFEASNMVCAGDLVNRIDTCVGDSGGPLALDIAGVRTLIGDTSFGPNPCASTTAPGVYGRISAFRPWLAEQLQVTPPAPSITSVTNAGSAVSVTWAEPTGDSAWAAIGFDVTDGTATASVEAPALAGAITRTAGGTLTLTVSARNAARSAVTTWSGVPTPTRAPVVAATVPTAPRVGTALTASATSDDPWGGAIAYQWLVNGSEVAGATSAAYRPVAADAGKALSVRVAAANAAGTGTATVAAGRVRQAPQVKAGAVRVTGSARVGGRLRARPPAVRGYPAPKATYRWYRDGRLVRGARTSVFRVRPVDAGARITGRVTWRNASGTVTRALRPVRIAG